MDKGRRLWEATFPYEKKNFYMLPEYSIRKWREAAERFEKIVISEYTETRYAVVKEESDKLKVTINKEKNL